MAAARTALILYASETGNSQNVAEELDRITERLRFSTRVVEMDAIKMTELSTATIVVFAISTTGQGDIPANGRKFWRSLLRKRLPPDYLCHVRYTSFGLGDSSYPLFNCAARKLNKRLGQLGAQEFYERGEADEQHPEGSDYSFLPWTLNFKKRLLDLFPLPTGVEPIPDDQLLIPKWKLDISQTEPNQTESTKVCGQLRDSSGEKPTCNQVESPRLPSEDLMPVTGSHVATLDSNIRLTPESHWQDVRHLKFSIPSAVDYSPGDILSIFPKNFPEDVEDFMKMMEWTDVADHPVVFHPSDPNSEINPGTLPIPNPPSGLTLRKLLTNYLDINSIPRRSFFANIALLATDATHKERLLEFANPFYTDELYDYTTRPRRSILEVLSDFPSVKIPWQWAATILPTLRPRQFSIASGGALKHPTAGITNIELLVAIVKYRTVIRKTREGVCTRYIAHLKPGMNLTVLVTKGGLGVTEAQAAKPVVMIGPGTGIAPMRSLIQERLFWSQTQDSALPSIGTCMLFYGGRNQKADFFFEEEWNSYQQSSNISLPPKIITAFSRDQQEKVYVQDRIRQEAKNVYELLREEKGGLIYVCGSSGRMPRAVREALIDVFIGSGGMVRGVAEGYLVRMEKEGRYVQETW